MAERRRRDTRGTKADRFAVLRRRRTHQSAQFEALERRQRTQASRLHAARERIATRAPLGTHTIETRRAQYVELAPPAPSLTPPRAALASLAAAFILPLVIALATGIVGTHNTITAKLEARHRALRMASMTRTLENKPSTLARPVAARQAGSRPAIAIVQMIPPVSPQRAIAPHARPANAVIAAATKSASNARPHAPASNMTRKAAAPVIASNAARPSAASQPAVTAQAPARPHAVAAAQRVALAQAPGPVPRPKTPWRLSADGTWAATVHAPKNMAGAQFDTSTGQLIALERSPVDGEAATVTIGWSRPVSVDMSADGQSHSIDLPAPDDSLDAFAATASAVGPHLVNVGWTPLAAGSAVVDYKVYRTSAGSDPQMVASLAAAKHSWSDTNVSAGVSYSYDVVADTSSGAVEANTQSIVPPDELPVVPASAIAGKGMFLYFSSIPGDPRYFGRYHPEAVVAEAKHAGIHAIELRMARGSCAMAQTEGARAWLDRLIDAAAHADINLVAWTVPRRVTTQDLAETLAAAAYRTPAGNGFVGVALDLESGDRYMGDGPKAVAAMVRYIRMVRAAAGPHYLIVATVASPEMGNHTNADYPYARIAAYADVLQPMEYWHYFDQSSHHEYARREVAGASAGAVARTRALAGRDIPVNVAGQSVALEGTDSPSGREIEWSLGGAKSAGGIGETFFDWAGTGPDAWAAIQAFDW
ncbi:MAG: hypothetical protein JO009_06635 [Candidatus Eremiobacteraeota bacterium]|nr:hypothetical protein [Candidatus Eremiobacteraeota bacterium]